MTEEVSPEPRSRKTFWILVGAFAIPYVLAAAFYFSGDLITLSNRTNHGVLIEPIVPMGDIALEQLDGQATTIADFQGKWSMVTVEAVCEKRCLQNLYALRQVRLALAKERLRVNRILVVDPPDRAVLEDQLLDYSGTQALTGSTQQLMQLRQRLQRSWGIDGGIFIVDPQGNYMMAYPPDSDPKGLLKDMQRLLKMSKIG